MENHQFGERWSPQLMIVSRREVAQATILYPVIHPWEVIQHGIRVVGWRDKRDEQEEKKASDHNDG